MKKHKWFLKWWEFLIILGVFVVTPPILNYVLFTWKAPWTYGKGDDWLGFWGNYSGAFVGALVALWILHRQFEEQRRLDSENRKLAQLPALVFLGYELNRMAQELSKVLAEREVFAKHSGIGKAFSDLTEEEKRLRRHEVQENVYDIQPINTNSYSYIASIEDVDLHVALIECFDFYREFSSVVSQEHNREKATGELLKHYLKLQENPSKENTILYNQLSSKLSEAQRVKWWVWKRLEEEQQISKFYSTYGELVVELKKVKRLKESI